MTLETKVIAAGRGGGAGGHAKDGGRGQEHLDTHCKTPFADDGAIIPGQG
jgi:hypothetical protein